METNFSDTIPTNRIVFRINKGKLKVSCFCRANPLKKGLGREEYYDPFEVGTYESVYEAYNRPENHYAPFSIGDQINAQARY